MSETNLAKIAISSTADEALTKSLERVNRDFDGGRVTKIDLATWFILRTANSLDDTVIKEVHQAHFNQAAYLENLVKKLKASGRENLALEELSALQMKLRVSKKYARQSKENIKP